MRRKLSDNEACNACCCNGRCHPACGRSFVLIRSFVRSLAHSCVRARCAYVLHKCVLACVLVCFCACVHARGTRAREHLRACVYARINRTARVSRSWRRRRQQLYVCRSPIPTTHARTHARMHARTYARTHAGVCVRLTLSCARIF